MASMASMCNHFTPVFRKLSSKAHGMSYSRRVRPHKEGTHVVGGSWGTLRGSSLKQKRYKVAARACPLKGGDTQELPLHKVHFNREGVLVN